MCYSQTSLLKPLLLSLKTVLPVLTNKHSSCSKFNSATASTPHNDASHVWQKLYLPAKKMPISTVNSMRCFWRRFCVRQIKRLCFKLSFRKFNSPATARKWTPFDGLVPLHKSLKSTSIQRPIYRIWCKTPSEVQCSSSPYWTLQLTQIISRQPHLSFMLQCNITVNSKTKFEKCSVESLMSTGQVLVASTMIEVQVLVCYLITHEQLGKTV